jgi:hypothetical protein
LEGTPQHVYGVLASGGQPVAPFVMKNQTYPEQTPCSPGARPSPPWSGRKLVIFTMIWDLRLTALSRVLRMLGGGAHAHPPPPRLRMRKTVIPKAVVDVGDQNAGSAQ